ncbi:MAG TPA: PQQ-binding-like beta-propeller repeat protein [Kofleriaceae bacterium]|jgi:outer membrane protein assembly factor BamB
MRHLLSCFNVVALAACSDARLPPIEPPSDFEFVVAADSHVPSPNDNWDGGDVENAVSQAVAASEHPVFFTILGDLTGGAKPDQFDRVEAAVRDTGVVWIPVAGNHDFYDGGTEYTKRYGTGDFSFDVQDVHFIVENSNNSDADQLAFIQSDLAVARTSRDVVVMCHHSPSDEVAAAMSDAGVTYLLTGHWHADRVLQRAGLVEIGIAPFLMGGLDGSAAGYRVFTYRDGELESSRRETVEHEDTTLIWPRSAGCVSAVEKIIVAVTGGAIDRRISYRIDGGATRALKWVGGWDYSAGVTPLQPGAHYLEVLEPNRPIQNYSFALCTDTASFALVGDWDQIGGGPEHRNAAPVDLVPPLVAQWTTAVGGRINGASTVASANVVVVTTTDSMHSTGGQLVALSLANGGILWSRSFDVPLAGAAALVADRAIVATKNGDVLAIDLANGNTLWTYSATRQIRTFDATTWSAPALLGDTAIVAMAGQLVALSAKTGAELWTFTPNDKNFHWLGTLASPAVAASVVIAAFDRTAGLVATSGGTDPSWYLDDSSVSAINASPVVADGIVYVLNAAGRLSARQVEDGALVFSAELTPTLTDWDYTAVATPAVGGGRIFVATQRDYLYALDAKSGVERWRARGEAGPITVSHYDARQSGWACSPLLVGDTLYIGSLDGTLVAFDAVTGARKWQAELGAPVTSNLVPVGDGLVVTTYDGSVRLLTVSK